jgi:hypothetical protein
MAPHNWEIKKQKFGGWSISLRPSILIMAVMGTLNGDPAVNFSRKWRNGMTEVELAQSRLVAPRFHPPVCHSNSQGITLTRSRATECAMLHECDRSTNPEYADPRRERMIAVIDVSSVIRHICFEVLSKVDKPVAVFYSVQTFINSGAVLDARRLVLGQTNFPRTVCEVLRLASAIRPGLCTLLLDPCRIELRSLREVCTESINRSPDNTSVCLDSFRKALDLGLL